MPKINLNDDVTLEVVGLNIKAVLNARGLDENWLATATGLNRVLFIHLRQGKGSLDDARISKIANATKLSATELTTDHADDVRDQRIGEILQSKGVKLTSQVNDSKPPADASIVSPGKGVPKPDVFEVPLEYRLPEGRVKLNELAPDLDQPRQYMDPDELAALAESIAHRGIRQSLTVTPLALAPWANWDHQKYPNARYLIVSGHRRTEAGLMAKAEDAPAEVKVYQNQTDHHLDGSLLNGLRADLSPLEQGYELARLLDAVGKPQLAEIMGRSVMWVNARLNLVALDPWIQAKRLHPMTTDRQSPQLQITVAAKLGGLDVPDTNSLRRVAAELNYPLESFVNLTDDERRFMLQRAFLERIETYGLGTTAATHLVDKVMAGGRPGHGAHGARVVRRAKKPSKMRERVSNMSREIAGHSVFNWDGNDFAHAFDGATLEWATGVLEELEIGIEQMQKLAERLKRRFPTLTSSLD